jgi:hypothetical protein
MCPMNRVEIEMFSETTNCPIVRIPGRRFPGVVIQGDSLMTLSVMAKEVCDLASAANNADLTDAAGQLVDRLWVYLSEYERAMAEHGLELPYPKPMTK